MTKEEIYKKLETLKTDEGKFSYLKEISKKAGILSSETKKALYETLGDYALATNHINEATKAYEKAGSKEGFIKIGDKWFERGELDDAIELYEKAGYKEGLIKVGDKLVEKGELDRAVKAYEKAGLSSGTKAEMEKLADAYEKANMGKKAMKLRKKIKQMS